MPLHRVRFTVRRMMVAVAIVAAFLTYTAQMISGWQRRTSADQMEWAKGEFLRMASESEAESLSDPRNAARVAKQAATLREACAAVRQPGPAIPPLRLRHRFPEPPPLR